MRQERAESDAGTRGSRATIRRRGVARVAVLAALWLCGTASLRAQEQTTTTVFLRPNYSLYTQGLCQGLDYQGDYLRDIAALAAFGYNNYALVRSNGTVAVFGYNNDSVLGVPKAQLTTINRALPISGLSNVTAVAVGNTHVLALKADQTVWAWGGNNQGQLGNGSTNLQASPVQVSGLTGVVAVAAGEAHSMALAIDGSVWAWGYNGQGQLGDGTAGTNRLTPVRVSGLSGVSAIACGRYHSLAIAGGAVWGWGNNWFGQLGDGTNQTNRRAPVQAIGLAGVAAIAGGDYHSLVMRGDGTCGAAGYNIDGQLGDGTTTQRTNFVEVSGLSNVTAIAAGGNASVVRKADGTLASWGNNAVSALCDTLFTNAYRATPGPVRNLDGSVFSNAVGRVAVFGGSPLSLATLRRAAPVSTNQTKICGNDRTTKIALSWSDPDSRAFELRAAIVTPPAHGTVSVGYGPNVYYTPVPGYTGADPFTWQVCDERGTSSVATCTLDVRDTPPGGTNRIALIVNAELYPSISNEVERLKTDILWEGKDAFIHVKSYGATRLVSGSISVYQGDDVGLWNYLNGQYTSNQLEGAILIGAQPDALAAATSSDIYNPNDCTFWSMSVSNYYNGNGTGPMEIWVTRINDNEPAYYSVGEAAMTKRALDANHYYRTGQLRYPHRFYWNSADQVDFPLAGMRGDYEGYVAVTPSVEVKEAVSTLKAGCMFDWQLSHGYPAGGDCRGGGLYNRDAFGSGAFGVNFVSADSCAGQLIISPFHQQMFTKYGGVVCTKISHVLWSAQHDYSPAQELLMRGGTVGDACLLSGLSAGVNAHRDGDYTVQFMQGPPNDMPLMSSLAASKTTVARGEPFTLTALVTDANAVSETNVFENYKHKVEWYMAGWNYGMNEPTAVSNDTVSATSKQFQYTHAFTNIGTYTVRALVMDEWRAVAWQEVTITVVDPVVTCAIDSPTNGAGLTVGTASPLTVTATTSYGPITNVTYYLDGVRLGSVTNAPFTYNWTPTAGAVGAHLLTAQAVDWQGTVGNASANITVLSRVTCALTTPSEWSVAKAGTNMTLEAAASSPDGGVSNVVFFANGQAIGSDATAPYACVWSNLAVGNYILTAVATDDSAQTGTASAVELTVTASGGWGGIAARGGTITNYTLNGTNFTAHIFTNSGTLTIRSGGDIEYLVVAGGGGGGGGYQGGGGGAGGLRAGGTNLPAASYAITVGSGGQNGTGSQLPGNGSNSVLAGADVNLVANGGGNGGTWAVGAGTKAASVGGSGGGGEAWSGLTGASGIAGQGNKGGNGGPSNPWPCGGGGGAGGVGGNGVSGTKGAGGIGISSSLSGSPVTYAAGGLGGINWTCSGADGGANTGNGGGGGGQGDGFASGGSGGSGIVIVRYEVASTSTYTVAYSPNGADSGTAPASQTKTQNVAVVVSGNTGNLAKTSHTFAGWNTASNGIGTDYAIGASYTANVDVTLYAKWVSNAVPTISVQPVDSSVTAGQTATFSVTASGTPTLVYQWFTNNAPISGANGASYTTPATTTNDSGWQFQVMVSNAFGAVTSEVATLTVNPAPTGGVAATGGTITNYTLGGTNFTAHIFTNSGALTLTSGGIVEYLAVGGGGGGGGGYQGGGGGAGGLRNLSTNLAAATYTITVGAGGKGCVGNSTIASNGAASSIMNGAVTVVSATGGGRGASEGPATAAGSGGSGGGGCRANGASGTSGEGYAGGNGSTDGPWPCGGGGGAAGVGQNGSGETPGLGGTGMNLSISGVAVTYATGGKGGWRPYNTGDEYTGASGAANTGIGGEGGGGRNGSSVPAGNGGNGGSGIVIVRYVTGGGGEAPSLPAAPTGFSATATATNRIELVWGDNATNETGYVVGRSVDSTNWTFATLTAANATNFSHSGLASNTLYYYRVAASNAAGLSAYAYASARTWTLVDVWQHEYFTPAQLTNTLVSGDEADPDGDGLLNWMERIAGTDPTNRVSSLALSVPTNAAAVAGKFVVNWQSVSGRTYAVMMATNLLTGFTNLATQLPATPPLNVHTDAVENAAGRFYRVQVE